MLDAAEEVEKLAGELDEAARLKLKADEQGSEQEVQHALGDASKDGHDLADKLKADGKEELGCVVEQVTVKVDGVVGGEHPDVQELQQTVCEAKDAAEKLREAGLPEEAAKMDHMVGELEHALQAELKAEELRRAAASKQGASDALDAAKQARETAAHLVQMPFFKSKPKQALVVMDAQELLEGGKASGEDLGHAADEMRDLAHTCLLYTSPSPRD